MSQMIESVEKRILFIASAGVIEADLAALLSAGEVAKANLAADVKQSASDTKVVKEAVLATHPTAAQKATVSHLQAVGASEEGKYKAKVFSLLKGGDADGKSLEAHLKALKAKPTSTALLAKVQADLTKLGNLFSNTNLTNAENATAAIVATVDTALNSVASAVPSAATATSAFAGHLAGDLTTLATELTTLQAAIAKLAGDFA